MNETEVIYLGIIFGLLVLNYFTAISLYNFMNQLFKHNKSKNKLKELETMGEKFKRLKEELFNEEN